jgi:hypothetical protein
MLRFLGAYFFFLIPKNAQKRGKKSGFFCGPIFLMVVLLAECFFPVLVLELPSSLGEKSKKKLHQRKRA